MSNRTELRICHHSDDHASSFVGGQKMDHDQDVPFDLTWSIHTPGGEVITVTLDFDRGWQTSISCPAGTTVLVHEKGDGQ